MISQKNTKKFVPSTTPSVRWRYWQTVLDLKTCFACVKNHGKIYDKNESPEEEPPLHWHCRCFIKKLQSIIAGKGTQDGVNGADWTLKHFKVLPTYYISESTIQELGWSKGKRPSDFAPGKMITRGVYKNRNGHLPSSPGRIWYEADINYYSGRRNGHRILWSNDGLIFVTYDHYMTFIEIL